MEYRKEVDGLRALAVLPVILFHAGFEAFSGGFVGVDMFFVISGYLITTIIVSDLAQGKFSVATFYERRARRILPALFAVLLVCLPLAWVLLWPSALNSFSGSLVAVPLFYSNFFFWRDVGYFESAAELKPLLHTWSLAVEEQFYVLFPLFLVLVWKFGKFILMLGLGTLFFASLFLAEFGSLSSPDATFYLLPTRGWELIVGAFIALYLSTSKLDHIENNLKDLISTGGLILILYSIFTYNKATPFPGFYALAPTIGTALIILFSTSQTKIGKILGNRVLVGIGLVSYSAYLWHQPVFAFARNWLIYINQVAMIYLTFLVFIISIFSWKYIEQPFRHSNKFSRKFIIITSLFLTLFFVIVGYLSTKIVFNREIILAKELTKSSAVFATNMNERVFVKHRIMYEEVQPEALIIGSSRAMQVNSQIVGKDVLNLSVSGASIQDLIAIWGMSSDKFNSKTIFFGADPWMFNKNSGQNRWYSIANEFESASVRLGLSTDQTSPVLPPLPFYNTKAVEFYNFVNKNVIRADDDTRSIFDKIRKDGSRVYNQTFSKKTQPEIERRASTYRYFSMTDYKFAVNIQTMFTRLVAGAAKPDKKIVLILSPYHPKLYATMHAEDRKFLEIESIYRHIAKINGIQIIGSYDPAVVGCNADDFYDGMHPKGECMKKVFAQLK